MENEALVKEVCRPLHAGKGWLTFLGVLSIVYGAAMALSIVGLIVAWLPIWIGVLLLQASSALDEASRSGDPQAMMRAMARLKTYFVVWGVIALIGLVLAALPLAIMALTGGFYGGGFMGTMPAV